MKFNTFFKKNKLLVLLVLVALLVASYFLFFKKENFADSDYLTEQQCVESRVECNSSEYPDKEVINISSDPNSTVYGWGCLKKCSLVPDKDGRYPFNDFDKQSNTCIIYGDNTSQNDDGTPILNSATRPFIPATCDRRSQCKRVSCPANTTLLTYGGWSIAGRNNETTVNNESLLNNTCTRKCEEKSGMELSEDDLNCMYFNRATGTVDYVSKVLSKPICEESEISTAPLVAISPAATCTYRTQTRTLAGFNTTMKCPTGHTLETYTKSGNTFARCMKYVNKVNNKCPSNTFSVSNTSKQCRQSRNPVCKDSRERFDKATSSCLRGVCARGTLLNKKCYICSTGFRFNETTRKCEKTGSTSQNPTQVNPVCYAR